MAKLASVHKPCFKQQTSKCLLLVYYYKTKNRSTNSCACFEIRSVPDNTTNLLVIIYILYYMYNIIIILYNIHTYYVRQCVGNTQLVSTPSLSSTSTSDQVGRACSRCMVCLRPMTAVNAFTSQWLHLKLITEYRITFIFV